MYLRNIIVCRGRRGSESYSNHSHTEVVNKLYFIQYNLYLDIIIYYT